MKPFLGESVFYFSLSPTIFLFVALWTSAVRFSGKLLVDRPSLWPTPGSEVSTLQVDP